VCIGASVRLSRNGKEFLFHIGGYGESDLDLNIISYNAPILAPLFRHEVGYVATAIIGKTDTELKILEIHPCEAVKFF
jgi:transcription elongation GreA/GreB family factor